MRVSCRRILFAAALIAAAQTPFPVGATPPHSPLELGLGLAPSGSEVEISIRSEVDVHAVTLHVNVVPGGAVTWIERVPEPFGLAAGKERTIRLPLAAGDSDRFRIDVSASAWVHPDLQVGDLVSITLRARGRNGFVEEPRRIILPAVVGDQVGVAGDAPLGPLSYESVPAPDSEDGRSGESGFSGDTSDARPREMVDVRGAWRFNDYAVTALGVSATPRLRPFRRARLEIQKQVGGFGWETVATLYTAVDGSYAQSLARIAVGRDILRSRICTVGPDGSLRGREPLSVKSESNGEPYCYVTLPRVADLVTDLGLRDTPPTEAGSGPVNIYDTILEAYEFLSTEVRPPATALTAFWDLGVEPARCGGASSCYLADVIRVNGAATQGDQWDDAVLAHEVGHWVMDRYAAIPPNAAGPHGTCRQDEPPNLQYSEGWATFFGSASRSASNDVEVRNSSPFYLDTQGGIGSRVLRVFRNLKTTTVWGGEFTGRGTFCENDIAAALWDIFTAGRTMEEIVTASATKYAGHFPYNINEWWYGWTGTQHRARGSLGGEQELLDIFDVHAIDVGLRLELTWPAAPADLDAHLWLPESDEFHVRFTRLGSAAAFPYAVLDGDDIDGNGPENIWITSPFPGTYRFAAFNWTDQSDATRGIAGTGARIRVYNASDERSPRIPTANTVVPASGVGDWWRVLDIDGATGALTNRTQVQVASPGPYDPEPALRGFAASK